MTNNGIENFSNHENQKLKKTRFMVSSLAGITNNSANIDNFKYINKSIKNKQIL